uniref:Uncharacterized protein n=1 Tax=Anguilla anguilla TaxID=7936 RepID=A0A0E9WRQ8_ANGAN
MCICVCQCGGKRKEICTGLREMGIGSDSLVGVSLRHFEGLNQNENILLAFLRYS